MGRVCDIYGYPFWCIVNCSKLCSKVCSKIVLLCPGSGLARSGQGSKGFSGAGGSGLVKLSNGTVLCRFYQQNGCKWQTADSCSRATGTWKHLCAAAKTDGSICAGKHSKLDHK